MRDSNRAWAAVLQMHYRDRSELANVDGDITFLEDHDHKGYNTREGLLEEMWSFLKDKSYFGLEEYVASPVTESCFCPLISHG